MFAQTVSTAALPRTSVEATGGPPAHAVSPPVPASRAHVWDPVALVLRALGGSYAWKTTRAVSPARGLVLAGVANPGSTVPKTRSAWLKAKRCVGRHPSARRALSAGRNQLVSVYGSCRQPDAVRRPCSRAPTTCCMCACAGACCKVGAGPVCDAPGGQRGCCEQGQLCENNGCTTPPSPSPSPRPGMTCGGTTCREFEVCANPFTGEGGHTTCAVSLRVTTNHQRRRVFMLWSAPATP